MDQKARLRSAMNSKTDQDHKIYNLSFSIWTVLRSLLVTVTAILLVISAFYYAGDYALRKFWMPPSTDDHTPIQVVIERGTSTAKIAQILHAYGIISNPDVFEYYVDFSGYNNKMQAGTYVFNKTMTMEDVMQKLADGSGQAHVMDFMIIEGSSIDVTAEKLLQDGAIESVDDFLELCKTGEEFRNYAFIGALDDEEVLSRKYIMEGYLFPAKYEIYVNSSEETIIKKMLKKFSDVFDEKRVLRAEELGMTIDEVITLASMIEKEAGANDFYRVSAVFHNRLNQSISLESCATVQYIIGTTRIHLTDEDISVDSPYNTYIYDGLPAGPICSPSEKAIDAALNPDQEFIDQNYLFFATKDPASGELAFSRTAEEHAAVVAEYAPLWDEYDRNQD